MSTPEATQGGFDLSTAPDLGVIEDEGLEVQIVDLDGEVMYYAEDKPVRVWMAGTYSNRYRRALEAQGTRTLKRSRSRKVDGAAVAREARELIASCALRWEGFFEDGSPLDCTRQNAARVFERGPHIQEQCASVMGDHEAFFTNS